MFRVLALLVVGIAVGNLRLLPAAAGPVLDQFLVRIAVPGLILTVVPRLDADPRAALPAVVAWAVIVGLTALVWVVARLVGLDRRTTGTLLVIVPLGNTGFLGYPAVEALLGRELLPFAVVYDQLGTFLAMTTLSTVVAARYGAGEVPPWRQMVRRVVTFPPFLALVVALALLPLGGLPEVLAAVTGTLADTVTPVAMIAVGMRLHLSTADVRPGVLAGGLAARMVIAPAIVLLVAGIGGGTLDELWQVSVLESAMPPMVLGGVIATAAGLDERLSAHLVAVGAIVSMATLPGWAWLVT